MTVDRYPDTRAVSTPVSIDMCIISQSNKILSFLNIQYRPQIYPVFYLRIQFAKANENTVISYVIRG